MRRRVIVDRDFQIKTSLIGAAGILLLFSIIFGTVGVGSWRNDLIVNKTILKLEDTMTDQKNIIVSLRDSGVFRGQREQRIAADVIAKNLSENNRILEGNINQLNGIIKVNRLVFWILFILIVAQGCLVFFLVLRWSLRIAGPVRVMRQNVKRTLAGEHVNFRPIRAKDELQDLYSLVAQLASHASVPGARGRGAGPERRVKARPKR